VSCGNPHAVDCSHVLEEVYLYLDGELDAIERELVREHLDECSPCLRKFGLEQEVKALVARSCSGEVAPPALRARVLQTLRTLHIDGPGGVQVDVTTEITSTELRFD
jgi:mycothiol system anti-sigma-R factor